METTLRASERAPLLPASRNSIAKVRSTMGFGCHDEMHVARVEAVSALNG